MNESYLKIREDLEKMGIKKGDRVLVHSSLKSMGEIEGGVTTFINAIKDAVTREGTLLFPTFTFDFVTVKNPVFDVRYTQSCVGYIPEAFRHTEGVKRSLHPTHSVAVWGKDRDRYIANHNEDDTCLGLNSPLFKLKEDNGKILMIGCGINHNTLLHGLEVYLKPPYALSVDYTDPKYHREYSCIDENGKISRKEFFHVFLHEHGFVSDFNKLREICPIEKGNILKAESFVMNAREVWDTGLNKMKEDPFFFVRKV